MPACPVCEADVPVPGDAIVHELVDCGDCATELEIASLSPPLLKEAPQEEEDWGE
jgi:alpha-aminoadipate carrier protein LysW